MKVSIWRSVVYKVWPHRQHPSCILKDVLQGVSETNRRSPKRCVTTFPLPTASVHSRHAFYVLYHQILWRPEEVKQFFSTLGFSYTWFGSVLLIRAYIIRCIRTVEPLWIDIFKSQYRSAFWNVRVYVPCDSSRTSAWRSEAVLHIGFFEKHWAF